MEMHAIQSKQASMSSGGIVGNPAITQHYSITTAKQFARRIFADYLVSNVAKLTGKLCEP
jgi:hypothetical protein